MIFVAGCYGEMSASATLHPITTNHPQAVAHMHHTDHKLATSALCPSECNVTCGTACASSCCATDVPVATVSYSAPTSTPTLLQPPPNQCAVPCGAICAPACTPACCYTVYRPQMVHYSKRNHLHAYVYRHTLKLKNVDTNKTIRRKAKSRSTTQN